VDSAGASAGCRARRGARCSRAAAPHAQCRPLSGAARPVRQPSDHITLGRTHANVVQQAAPGCEAVLAAEHTSPCARSRRAGGRRGQASAAWKCRWPGVQQRSSQRQAPPSSPPRAAAHLYLNLLREIFWCLFQAPRLDGRALLYLWGGGGRRGSGQGVGACLGRRAAMPASIKLPTQLMRSGGRVGGGAAACRAPILPGRRRCQPLLLRRRRSSSSSTTAPAAPLPAPQCHRAIALPALPPAARAHLWPVPRRPRYFWPAEVRPRSSRCLCTALQIQLMRGSCAGEGRRGAVRGCAGGWCAAGGGACLPARPPAPRAGLLAHSSRPAGHSRARPGCCCSSLQTARRGCALQAAAAAIRRARAARSCQASRLPAALQPRLPRLRSAGTGSSRCGSRCGRGPPG
jgi:hypothetical protein